MLFKDWCFLFFSSPQSWFLWQGLSETRAKIVSWKLENWKTNTSPLIKNRLLTLKGLSLSPTLFKVLLQNPPPPKTKYPPHPKRTPNPTQSEQERSSPFMQEASVRLSGQNARRRKRRNCLTHTTKCQKGNTIWQPDKWPIIHLLFLFFYDFFFLFILLSPQWNSMHWLGDPKKNRTSSGKWWSRMCKLKRLPPKFARLHIFVFFCVPHLQVHGPTWPPPPPHLQLSAAQGPDP